MPQLSRLALAAFLGLFAAACSSSPGFHGSPPLSNLPTKIETFAKPYEDALGTFIGPGTVGAAIIVGPHFMPGACEGWITGDRKIMCDLRARYLDGPKEAKADENMRFRCIRTLGGGTECNEVARAESAQ